MLMTAQSGKSPFRETKLPLLSQVIVQVIDPPSMIVNFCRISVMVGKILCSPLNHGSDSVLTNAFPTVIVITNNTRCNLRLKLVTSLLHSRL
jgi:hypothetical protein